MIVKCARKKIESIVLTFSGSFPVALMCPPFFFLNLGGTAVLNRNIKKERTFMSTPGDASTKGESAVTWSTPRVLVFVVIAFVTGMLIASAFGERGRRSESSVAQLPASGEGSSATPTADGRSIANIATGSSPVTVTEAATELQETSMPLPPPTPTGAPLASTKSPKKKSKRKGFEPVPLVNLSSVGREQVTKEWKVRQRRKCVAKLERITDVSERKPDRGKWAVRVMRGIQKGIKICPVLVPPTSEQGSRRIFIDIGAAAFGSSVMSQFLWYPNFDSFEVRAFEADPGAAETYTASKMSQIIPWINAANVHFHNAALGSKDGFISFLSRDPTFLANYKKDRQLTSTAGSMQFHETKAQTPQDAYLTIPVRSIAKYLINDLKITARDYVIVKLDIEGGEWEILDALQRNTEGEPDMPPMTTSLDNASSNDVETVNGRSPLALGLVDEMMIECHDSSMGNAFKDVPFSRCFDAFRILRERYAVFAHEWT